MSRAVLREIIVDGSSNPISNATVTLRTINTASPIGATIFAGDTGGTTLSNPITSGANGEITAYLDAPQRVDLFIQAAGMVDTTIPDVAVLDDPANLVHRTGVETLTQKTLSSPTINSPSINGGSWTSPTLTSPAISGGTLTGSTLVSPVITGPLTIPAVSSDYALTTRNTHADEKGFRVRNAADTLDLFKVDKQSVFVPYPAKFGVGIGGGAVSANSEAGFYGDDTNLHKTMVDIVYINRYAGGDPGADVSALRVVSRQDAGDAYNRPLEVHQLALTGSLAFVKVAGEFTSQFNHVGNGLDRTVGISIRNLGGVWGMATPQRGDTAFLIGGDQQGWENLILAQDMIGAGAGTLFRVNKLGDMLAKSATIGASGYTLWRAPLQAAASGNLTLTTSDADIPGASVALDRKGRWLVIGSFYFDMDPTDGVVFALGTLVSTGGTAAISNSGSSALLQGSSTIDIAATVSRSWFVNVTALTPTVKLQAKKGGGAGGSIAGGTYTAIEALWLGEV